MPEELQEFIEANRELRELKRGMSVQIYLEGYTVYLGIKGYNR